MSTIIDPFFSQSPHKILQKAELYSKTLQNFHQLPHAHSKINAVRKNAEEHKNQIEFGIQQSQYQKQLYRKKEAEDLQTRQKYEKMIKLSQEKNEVNGKEIEKKKAKDAERYEKHLKEVYKKYDEEQKKLRDHQKEESMKLKKELIQFYEKQHHRRKMAHRSQINVGTCYQSAVERINNIHRKNEEYSKKAEQSLEIELKKNSHHGEIIREKRRSLSSCNKRKERQYRNSIDFYNSLEHSFIQKYGKNEDSSLKAWKAIDQECGKTTKRIGEFFKKRYQRWSADKKKVDEAKEQISQRCTSILQKTNQAAFRQTSSSFRSTAREWQDTVQKNKTAIREFQEIQKDKIISAHLDLRLKNQSTSKINDRMKVMRLQAKKLAYDFL